MGFVAGNKGRILIGDFHYSTVAADMSLGANVDMLDVSVLTSTAKDFIPNTDTSTASINGYLDVDGSQNAHFDQMNDWKSAAAEPLTYAPNGLALSSELVMVSALETSFSITSANNAAVGFSLATQTDGRTDFGVSLADLTARTSSSTGTANDNSASTANGGVGHLHVTAYSGFTSVAVIIEHSSDNSTFATLGSFASVSALTSERLTIASGTTVNRYVRAKWTVTGAGSITFQVGFARR